MKLTSLMCLLRSVTLGLGCLFGVSQAAAAPDELYPKGDTFSFTFYSCKDADALYSLTNGATAIGPYYGSQTSPLANAVAWHARLLYKVIPPSIGNLGAADFDAPGFVWPSDVTISNEVAAIVSAVQTNANIAFWDMQPEELRPWKPAEMNALRVIYSAIHANDPSNRPAYMYQPNNRTAAQLGVAIANQDLCLKGTYVNSITDDLGGSCMTNRIWARWSMEQEVQACALYNTNAKPWITLWMAADPPAGTTADTVTNWCRHDAYMGLIMGGKGVNIWSGFRGRSGFSDPWFNAYLGGYLTVGNDLNGSLNLAPVFLFGQTQTNAAMNITVGPATQTLAYGGNTTNYPSITYRAIGLNGTNYLFMVNSAQQSVTATFSGLPWESRLDLFAGTNAATPGGTFSITLPPLGVSAFRFNAASNVPPVFLTDPILSLGATIGSGYSNSIAGSATDPDVPYGDTLTFSKIAGPAWLNVAPNGVITGTPPFANFGANTFTVQVTDSHNASDTATLLINASSPNCGPTVVLNENFAGETLATLAGQGWTFSGQPGAELVGSTANSAYLGNLSYLRIGSNTVSQPFAQKSFGSVTNGQFKAITFTTSSYSNSRLKLLNAGGSVLFDFLMATPNRLDVENISPAFSVNPMTNSGTHNLLSSSSPPLAFTELAMTWGGSNVTWQAINRLATDGTVVYDTGIQTGAFTNPGVPSQLRLDTGTYNNSARYFGTTGIQVLDTTGCPGEPPLILPALDASGGNFNFQFAGTTGQHYRVEFTPVLPGSGSWQVVTDIGSLPGSPYMVSHPMTNSQGYYRVILVP